MKKNLAVAVGILTLLFSTTTAQEKKKDDGAKDLKLKVGDVAPDWKLTGSDGKVYKLSDFKDKRGVVVAWYPMALTGG